MKTTFNSYKGDISMQIVPETDQERTLFHALFSNTNQHKLGSKHNRLRFRTEFDKDGKLSKIYAENVRYISKYFIKDKGWRVLCFNNKELDHIKFKPLDVNTGEYLFMLTGGICKIYHLNINSPHISLTDNNLHFTKNATQFDMEFDESDYPSVKMRYINGMIRTNVSANNQRRNYIVQTIEDYHKVMNQICSHKKNTSRP